MSLKKTYISGEYSLWNLSAFLPSLALHFYFFLSAYERLVFCMFTRRSTVLIFQNQQSVLSATTGSYYRVYLFMGVPCKRPRPPLFFLKGWNALDGPKY